MLHLEKLSANPLNHHKMKKEKSTTTKNSLKTIDVFESEEKISRVRSVDKKFAKNHKNALFYEDESVLDDEYYYGRYDIQENYIEVEEEFND